MPNKPEETSINEQVRFYDSLMKQAGGNEDRQAAVRASFGDELPSILRAKDRQKGVSKEEQDKELFPKNMGGMMQYNMGGSMLVPPEREGYRTAGLVKLLVGAFTKTPTEKAIVKQAKNAHKSVEDLSMKMSKKKAIEQTAEKMNMPVVSIRELENQFAREAGGGKTDTFFEELGQAARTLVKNPTRGQIKNVEIGGGETRAAREKGLKYGAVGSAATAIAIKGPEALSTLYSSLNESERDRREKEFSKAVKRGDEFFNFTNDAGQTYSIKVEIASDVEGVTYSKTKKMSGGKIKYAEGSMLMPPEMEADQEMPVDTYDNIPEDEKAEAEASQLPDAEMEDNYLEYVLNESLDEDDQEYLMGVLEGDERLSGIFDKVMDVAGEFSGEGAVDGPGTGVSDSIPARLSDGEFVFTKKATDQIGADKLQTMMDEAEMAYDGGYMKKAFGGLTLDPMQDEKMYGAEQMKSTQNELRKQMLGANRMPSVLQ